METRFLRAQKAELTFTLDVPGKASHRQLARQLAGWEAAVWSFSSKRALVADVQRGLGVCALHANRNLTVSLERVGKRH